MIIAWPALHCFVSVSQLRTKETPSKGRELEHFHLGNCPGCRRCMDRKFTDRWRLGLPAACASRRIVGKLVALDGVSPPVNETRGPIISMPTTSINLQLLMTVATAAWGVWTWAADS